MHQDTIAPNWTTDGLSATGARAYSVTVTAAMAVNPATLPVGAMGTAYSQTVTASGGSGSALNYGAACANSNSMALGLYLGYSMQVGAATLEPGLRLEQRRVHSGGVDQSVAYADMPGTSYMLRQAGESDGLTSAALSLLLRFGLAATLGFEYSYTGSNETFRNESVRAIFRAPF